MKTKELLFFVLFLASHLFYGQEIKNKTIFGKHYSQHMQSVFKQKNAVLQACDTLASFNCKYIPTGLTWDGSNFWVVDTGKIYKVSPAGIYLDSIPNPATIVTFLQGGDLAYDGINLWYADEQSALLFKIDPLTKNVQEFPLPTYGSVDPNGFSIAWDGDHLWHCTYEPPVLYKLNPANAHILDSMAMDKEILTMEWIKGKLYGLGNDMFYTINTLTGIAEDSINWCVPFPFGIAWDGTAFWNVSGPSKIFGFPTGGLKKVFKMNSDVNIGVEKNFNSREVTLFPNPASESTVIKGDRITQVEIFDVAGNLMYRKNGIKQLPSVEISISTFPKGMYLTRVYDESGISTKKLIVQ